MRTVVEALKVSFCYGSGELRKQILFAVDMRVSAGEVVLLTGPSGSGKTTLLTLIGALRTMQQGRMNVLGCELNGATGEQRIAIRRQMGFVFQAHNLHRSLTAQQNVRMGLELHSELTAGEMNRRACALLERVGLGHRIDHVPARLSGGERQRVAVARALVGRPKLLLADEPSAALDKGTGRTVVNLLRELAREQDTAILMVTHDNRILDIADRILDMEDGRIIREHVPEPLEAVAALN